MWFNRRREGERVKVGGEEERVRRVRREQKRNFEKKNYTWEMRQVILKIQGGAFNILGGFLNLVDALISTLLSVGRGKL